ncbi:ATPase [Nakamurella flava]|uniref:histidine kinase n=1 Tax=Nakamurella flava TaxID=2576308 RepID=A0A4U6QLQ5_9ACTN|nr:PAS domain-containing sensor histidine kinase [Nakamurella flava]TKV61484.1 ATPase [Nakamurella flava]
MSTLSDLLAEHSDLSGSAVVHLQALAAEWQLIADLSFSDLSLWLPTGPVDGVPGSFVCVAQARPTTGSTAFPDDRVSTTITSREFPLLRWAWEEERIVVEPPPVDAPASFIRREVIPVPHGGRLIALLERDTSSLVGREASQLETAYVDAADDLFQMVADGAFPPADSPVEVHSSPRAGDGFIRLDADGRVVYASPNALSAYHRLTFNGELVGVDLAQLSRSLIVDPFVAADLAAHIEGAVAGNSGLRMEAEGKAATVLFRALPLRPHDRPSGALVLVRDVTDIRRRDRALISKDATIREIHHRVKNNLQTVAALLRLQARRSADPSVRQALSESVRRVASIALVHETLSTSPDDRVDLDQIVDRLSSMISDVAAAETSARVRRIGSFGILGADRATPLVMVLAEVVQNALQHAFVADPATDDVDGAADAAAPASMVDTGAPENQVSIVVERSAKNLQVAVTDNGVGLPAEFSIEKARGLGLQIVRSLVASELLGTIEMGPGADGGTTVTLTMPLRRRT